MTDTTRLTERRHDTITIRGERERSATSVVPRTYDDVEDVRIPPGRLPMHTRSGRDVPGGILALAALVALVAGVPYALLTFTGSPLPGEMPSASTLNEQLGPGSLIAVLVILVWLAWAQLVLCVAVEAYAGVRGIGVPARVPLAGGSQAVAHRLVIAVLLLFTATTVIMPAFDAIKTGPVQSQEQQPAAEKPRQVQPPVQAPPPEVAAPGPELETKARVRKVYRVRPPQGRHHESLWEIAEKCLGDGRRYPEIYSLNKGKVQPDGSRLTIASLIRPGWVLDMPPDSIGVEVVTPRGGRGEPRVGERTAVRPAEQAAPPRAEPAASEPWIDLEWDWQHGLSVASLAAAGLLAALGRRRREQLWSRAFGHMIRRPDGDAAVAEQALRIAADTEATRLLDLGLRQLSAELAKANRTPPTVYGVYLGADSIDLWIAPAEREAPELWEAHDDGQVWRLRAGALEGLTPARFSDVLAPHPGLVSIGTDESGRILVDLEAAHGLIALRGPESMRRAALAALAVELATNRWSDHMRVTLVGFGEELSLVAPDRVRVAGSLAEVLPELEAHAARVRQALAASGADSVLTGRCRDGYGEAWMPHYLIMAGQPDEEEAERLVTLARTGWRMAAGYLIAGDVPGATWEWDVTADGHLHAGPLGFDVEAQIVPDQHYRAVVELFRTAGRVDGGVAYGEPETGPPVPVALPAGAPGADPGARPSVDIRIMGTIEMDAPGVLPESRRALCTEMLVYLATHPDGAHPAVLAAALWPRGVSPAVRDATIARVADWLGYDSHDRANLYHDERGRIRLGSEVRVDWEVFRWLVWRSAAEPGSEIAYMAYALELARGPLLDGRELGRYGWLAAEDLEYDATARVADVAHRLVLLRLEEGDARGAATAARAGLRLATGDETLWRDLLRATHAMGDHERLREVITELHRRTTASHRAARMQPETEALVEELLPRWRGAVASGE